MYYGNNSQLFSECIPIPPWDKSHVQKICLNVY